MTLSIQMLCMSKDFVFIIRYRPPINHGRGHYREISDRGLHVLTEVNTSRPRSAISHNDQTDEVNKLFLIWPFHYGPEPAIN